MSRRWVLLIGLGCLAALTAACFGRVLFLDELLVYRDAGHFYYPLYQKVQWEWEAGRWPLWAPEENGGMPLLGNPTAAVLYPLKVLYGSGLWDYAWGSRVYTVAHLLLAVAAMYALMRNWDVGRVGSTLAALAYGFGAPILFQYCNIIFLVGAAWVPLALRAADRWLRLGRRLGLAELAAILALQTLGGDPQVAYVSGLCAGAYAVGLSIEARGRDGSARLAAGVVAALAIWIGGTLASAYVFPGIMWKRVNFKPIPVPREVALPDPLRGVPWSIPVADLLEVLKIGAVLVVWGLATAWIWRRTSPEGRGRLGRRLAGLAAAGVVGAALTGAQLLPVLEFTRLSMRSAPEAPHDLYAFSVLPHRWVEFLWPEVFGSSIPENHSWLESLPPENPAKEWVPSLYLGGLTLVLALSAFGFRGGPPGRGWMSAILLVSLLAGLGEYGSPLWWARFSPDVADVLGPHDPVDQGSSRMDIHQRDGDGSPYWFLATLCPGFRAFRFPSKLLTFTCLAIAALAGFGWDRLESGRRRPVLAWAGLFLILSVAAIVATRAGEPAFREFLTRRSTRLASIFGPLDVPIAVAGIYRSLIHGLVVSAAVLALALLSRRWRSGAAVAALVITTTDLILANAGIVYSLPRSVYEEKPRVLAAIEAAEADRPSPGPYRIHRMSLWNPPWWYQHRSPDRLRTLVEWEYRTIQPKYGLLHGVDYTITEGTTELYDLWFFFAPFLRTLPPDLASQFGVGPDDRIVYHPRRGFDLWNTRYFLLPFYSGGWKEERRGFAAFLPDATRIAPAAELTDGQDGAIAWTKTEDWQVYRNEAAFPRAWAVHEARIFRPLQGLRKRDRESIMTELLHPADDFWTDATLPRLDFRRLAFVEVDEQGEGELRNALDGGPTGEGEGVTFVTYEPQRVEIEATLDRPGLVILADVFYPGWRLTIDDRPAPILRTNRLMRGALVPAGTHRLIYTYEPDSFRNGLRLSLAGLAGLLILGVWSRLSHGSRESIAA